MTDPKLIEAVARALCRQQIISNLRYDPPRDDEDQFIRRCEDASWNSWTDKARAAITAYEAARGDGVWVPRDITPAMAHALESNYAECIPPSMIHVANWRDAYRAMIAAAKGE